MEFPDDTAKPTLNAWIPFAKQHKENMIASSEKGDCPPAVIIEKHGKIQMIVVAPEVDKHLALSAIALLHTSLNPDVITMVLDARFSMGKAKEGETMEEAMAGYESGDMQKRVEEGNRGDIVDCLLCYRITSNGETSAINIPYVYEGKDGPPFKWLDDEPQFKDKLNLTGDKVSGFIPEKLQEIMKMPVFQGDETEQLKVVADTFLPEEREERIYYHSARAMMAMLAEKKYYVLDFISGSHPDWCGAKERGTKIVDKMVSDGFFPQEAANPVKSIIENHIAKKEFQDKFYDLLNENSYWLPATIRSDIKKFVVEFETFCVAPMMPKFDLEGNPISPDEDDDEDDNWDDDRDRYSSGPKSTVWSGTKKKGRRVKVWNGDQSEFLGEGNYVDDVKVYFIRLEDGSIQSNHNAEIEPEPHQIPDGADVIKAGKNPKIVLDNGDTVYGCQVWWEYV